MGRRDGEERVNPGDRQRAQVGAEGPEGLSVEMPSLREGCRSQEGPSLGSD